MTVQRADTPSQKTVDRRIGPATDSDLSLWPATELAALIRRRAISPVELVEIYLRRIESENQALNAYVFVAADAARAEAKRAEEAVMRGDALGPMHGLPIAVKDADDVAGMPTSCGSRLLAGQYAEADCPVVDRLRNAGAIVLGKTNMPEFGVSGVTDNRIFGPTSSPVAPQMNSLGSSGGSAAAAGGGLAVLAQGSDGGGSIRIPASACGVVGLKGTWGRVPASDRPNAFLHFPMTGIGPLARTVGDVALMMQVIDGHDVRDPFSFALPRLDYAGACQRDVRDLKVAFSPTIGGHPVTAAVDDVIRSAVAVLQEMVGGVEEREPEFGRSTDELVAACVDGFAVEVASIDRRFAAQGIPLYDEHRDELSDYVLPLIERGREIDAVGYFELGTMRTEIYDAIERVFDEYDLIIGPTLAVPGVQNATDGSLTCGPSAVDGRDVHPMLGWVLTYPCNIAGHPAASVPAGFTSDGVPVGLQVIGRRFHDDDVLALCAALERARPWHWRYPSPR